MDPTQLLIAAMGGNIDHVRALLLEHENKKKKNAIINVRDHGGNTPLMWASARGHVQVVRELIQKGGIVNARNSYGDTSLYFASRYGHLHVACLLLHHRADCSIANRDGATAASVAIGGCTRIDWGAFERAQKITPDNLWTVLGKKKKTLPKEIDVENAVIDANIALPSSRAITILRDEMKTALATIEKQLEALILHKIINEDRLAPSSNKKEVAVKDGKKNDEDSPDEGYQLIDCA
jgi:ankyrin repeat protein